MSKISSLFKSLINHNYIIKNKTFSLDNKHVNHINNNIDNINAPINNNSNSIKHYHYNNTTNNSGFSLLELSIVLIIIGILIIGVIRGYSLITASRIITLTNELTQYAFAAEQFSAKYGNLPGIIDNPQKILGPTAKSKIDDDKIDTNAINESASITNAESINFFNHLYLSGLLGESSAPFVGTNEDLSSKSEITKDSNYYPTLKSIKSMFIYVRGDDIDGNYNKLNRLTVSNYSNGILGINADLIFGLDNKVDDGLPLSGLISIVPTKISNYGSSDKSSSYNNGNNNINTVYTNNTINNIIDYYLMSSKSINSFNIINTANAENGNTKSNNSSTSCLVLDKSTNEIKYNTKGKNCFILKNIDSTQQNKISDIGLNGATGESCNLLNKDDYPNAESVAGTTILNGSKKTIKCNDGYTGNITITCNEGQVIHSGDTQCTFNGCKKYDNNVINSSLNAILTTNDIVNWDNIDETEKNNLSTNDDISYSKNDTIATLSCKQKEGYILKEGSNGYVIKCDGNDNIIVDDNGGCEYEVLTCSISDLTTNILGNEFVKTITQCNDESCSITNTNEIVDITTEESKTKTFNYNTYITINTCNTGYSAPENKRIIKCNENGEWETTEETKENMCILSDCKISDLSHNLLTNNSSSDSYVKTIIECNDKNCLTTKQNTDVNITSSENIEKIYAHGTYITINSCETGYVYTSTNNTNSSNNRVLMCNGGYWEVINNNLSEDLKSCRIKIDYYSPILYNDVDKEGSISGSIYKEVGDEITCNAELFGQEADDTILKICGINNYRIASDNKKIIIEPLSNYTKHLFCHGSYIPRDLGVGLNGSVGVDGWCDDWITNDTYKGIGANVSNGSSFAVSHNDTNVSASTTLVCNNGTWEIGSGSIVFEYSGSVKTFCAPYGLKDAGKSITFELWGGSSAYGNIRANGGYTKGIMGSNDYSDLQQFYVAVGQEGQSGQGGSLMINAFNGGGKSGGRSGTATYYSGGGATHVATTNGVLSSLENNKSAVLLVAGGGGGNTNAFAYSFGNYSGGSGGGGNNNGGDGGNNGGKGGTLTAGGTGSGTGAVTGSFGKGADCDSDNYCWGGGGGYYGGGTASDNNTGGAGGGSGYCDTSKFTCSGSNGERIGNGKVIISW